MSLMVIVLQNIKEKLMKLKISLNIVKRAFIRKSLLKQSIDGIIHSGKNNSNITK